MKRSLIALLMLQLLYGLSTSSNTGLCNNGGMIRFMNTQPRCICTADFIGQTCNLSAQRIIPHKSKTVIITTNYTYFYLQPTQTNYYKLVFNICMVDNPSQSFTRFNFQTENQNGAFRIMPPLYETIKLGEQTCTIFTTHYISGKKRNDGSFRKIVIGVRVMDNYELGQQMNIHDNLQFLNKKILLNPQTPVYSNEQNLTQSQPSLQKPLSLMKRQQILMSMSHEIYIPPFYYSSFIITLMFLLLIMCISSLIHYFRRRCLNQRLTIGTRQLHQLHDELLRMRYLTMQERRGGRRSISRLTKIEAFMPVLKYHYAGNKSLQLQQTDEQILTEQGQVCSICLLNFEEEEEIRRTPCHHCYHKECIDNWCATKMSCPICRQSLDHEEQIRKFYYDFIRRHINI